MMSLLIWSFSGRPDTSRCPLDGCLKAVRIHQEALQDPAVGHFGADLLVRQG